MERPSGPWRGVGHEVPPHPARQTRENTTGTERRPCGQRARRRASDRARPDALALAPYSLPHRTEGPSRMIIDRETFTELAVHLKLASDAVLSTAKHLAVLSNGQTTPDEHWAGTLDGLMNMNTEITVMERILRALMEANREEETVPAAAPAKKSEPLPS
jgi:hypothetical protein